MNIHATNTLNGNITNVIFSQCTKVSGLIVNDIQDDACIAV